MSALERVSKRAYDAGYDTCKRGRAFDNQHSLVSDVQAAYRAGYAARYEEEQQLTNQVEGQEKCHTL